jgi:hypothetical protein
MATAEVVAMDPEYVVLAGGSFDGEIHLVPAGETTLTRHQRRGAVRRAEQYEGDGRTREDATVGRVSVLTFVRSWESAAEPSDGRIPF